MELDVLSTHSLKKDFGQVNAPSYQINFEILDFDLVYAHKTHFYQSGNYHEVYASDWMVISADLPEKRVEIKSAGKYIPLSGNKMIYLPPFCLLELRVQEGSLSWETIGSSRHVVQDLLNPIVINEASLSKYKNWKDIQKLIQKFKTDPIFTIQNSHSVIAIKAKQYLDQKFKYDLKIGEMAKELGISREVMTREFTKNFGISPIEYRHRLRVFEALILVRKGKTFSDSLFEVGFKDPSQFNIQFKKILGGALPKNFKSS